jgi:3-methyladenine DNA glycosylase AlkD
MDGATVLEELRRLGKPATANIYRRHGAYDETWGVSFADLGALEKALRGRADLAEPLWDSAVYDARHLATRLADARVLSVSTVEAWVGAARDRSIAGAVADLVARRDDALELAHRWIAGDGEFVAYAGWTVVATLVMANRLDDAIARALAERVRETIQTSPNMTRHAITMALIGIGIACPGVRDDVYAVANAVGAVVVDHGKTGCVTPAVVPYVERALARQQTRRLGSFVRKPRTPSPQPRATLRSPGTTDATQHAVVPSLGRG